MACLAPVSGQGFQRFTLQTAPPDKRFVVHRQAGEKTRSPRQHDDAASQVALDEHTPLRRQRAFYTYYPKVSRPHCDIALSDATLYPICYSRPEGPLDAPRHRSKNMDSLCATSCVRNDFRGKSRPDISGGMIRAWAAVEKPLVTGRFSPPLARSSPRRRRPQTNYTLPGIAWRRALAFHG